MLIKYIKLFGITCLTSFAMNTQAATIQVNGVIGACTGLCAALSGSGNSFTATYDDQFVAAPDIEIEGAFGNILTFDGDTYAAELDFYTLDPTNPSTTTIPTPQLGLGAYLGGTSMQYPGISLETNGVDQVTVFGIGSTSGAPIWAILDLANSTFSSYLFTPDADPTTTGAQPAIASLAGGTFTTTVVPLPGAAWFMLSALGGLFGLKRARS